MVLQHHHLTRHYQPSTTRTSPLLRWLPLGEAEVVEAGPELAETTTAVTEETGEETAVVEVVVEVPTEAPNTPQDPQIAAVIATTFMEIKLGTAWPPQPAPGSTSALQDHETLTSLEKRKRLVMTSCFRA